MPIPAKTACRLLLCALLSVGLLTTAAPALADINKAQASAIAKKHGKGKVLKVTPVTHKKKKAFRVKLLQPSGKVIQILVDAKTGKIISGKK